MKKKKLIVIIAIFLNLCFISSLLAETITFKSGTKKLGKIIEKNNDFIKVEYDPNIIGTYSLEDIESIDGKTLSKIPIKTITPEAIKKNDVLTVKEEIEKGADANAVIQLFPPLTLAAMSNSLEVAKLLIEKGANISATDFRGNTALIWAAGGGRVEMVKLLIEKGADVKKGNDIFTTALHDSALGVGIKKEEDKRNYLEIAKLLIEKGADVNAKNKIGSTALINAANSNFLEMAELLIAKGADVNAISVGCTVLMIAARAGSLETARLLIEKGVDINAQDLEGYTALMLAADYVSYDPLRLKKENFLEIVKLLVEKGADVNAINKDGDTALKIAEESGDKEIAAFLKKYGAK